MRSHLHIKPGGGSELEYECEGIAKSCDEFDSESGCKAQGCTWK